MSIFIKDIQVKKSGPIGSRTFELGKLNLFFGRNETGKTYLVEFILKSLFRKNSSWNLRQDAFEGKLRIVGLAEDPINFTPGSAKKIEDYWDEIDLGLPRNMSRLLVVRGGDLNLAENIPGGVNRQILKAALTNQVVFDRIWDEIPASVRKSSLVDWQIIGPNQGLINTNNSLRADLAQTDQLVALIESRYSRGPAKELEIQIDNISAVLEKQQAAKQHLAHQLFQQQAQLQHEMDQMNEEALTDLRDRIRDFRRAQEEIKHLFDVLKGSEKDLQDYLWIESAEEIWQNNQLDRITSPVPLLGYLGIAMTAGGTAALIFNKFYLPLDAFWVGIGALLLGVIGIGLYLYIHLKTNAAPELNAERILIQQGFLERFGFQLVSQVEIRNQKKNLTEKYLQAKNNQKLLEQKLSRQESEKQIIESSFSRQDMDPPIEASWEESSAQLAAHFKHLRSQLHAVEIEISKLNILQDDAKEQAAEVDYDPRAVEENQTTISHLKASLKSDYQELETLKARACERIAAEITSPWPEIFHELLIFRSDLNQKLLESEADLIAKIGLTTILTQIQAAEEEKIIEDINTSLVSDLVTRITGKDRTLGFSEQGLFVDDPFQRFALEDISTGAREQILLALRLGIAAKIAGDIPLFLILDDAFQHSDWARREVLVSSMVKLAQGGWQVSYLTMDDHIRDLFLEAGKSMMKKDFAYFEL